MFKSSAGKLFFLFSLIFASSCSFGSVKQSNAPNQASFAATEKASEIPFSAKEPEVYQTEIVTQIFAGNERSERKIFAARNAARRVTIYNAGEKNEVRRLETGGQAFSLFPNKKVYTEFTSVSPAGGEAVDDFLTTEWLNQKTEAAFENLGSENNLTKYRVKPGGAENSSSEVIVFIDETLGISTRQEFYSVNGGERTLNFSVELKNFKTEAGDNLFELPKDYRKVSPVEFQEILRQERVKNE